MATKTKAKPTSLLDELRSIPNDPSFRDWFSLLTPAQQQEMNDIKGAYLSKKLIGLTVKTIWRRCKDRFDIRVSYDRFLDWLKK